MTFSIVGRCARTGMFGVAITTSSICVGARCPHARAGVGAVATQNVTNPDIAPRVLDRLVAGDTADIALGTAMRDEAYPACRQVTVVDAAGRTAIHTGEHILGTNADARGEGSLAAGNLLGSPQVPAAMIESFAQGDALHLAERLLRALEAGVAAGGEEGPIHSAALYVVSQTPFPLVDLRVDWADEDAAVPTLRTLWQAYEPQMQAYLDRALNPSVAPSYGVPGDR
ncbi:MAG: DUF1028 domain-containing protein [Pseudomonadota bacterium]